MLTFQRIVLAAALSVLSPVLILHAQWVPIGDVRSFAIKPDGVTLETDQAIVVVSALAPDLIRVRATRRGTDEADRSRAVVAHDWGTTAVRVTDQTTILHVKTDELRVRIQKKPLRILFTDRKGILLNKDDDERGISWSGTSVRVWKSMPQTEQLYGLGEKAGALNRKYSHLTMWNTDIPAYKADTDPLYEDIPFFYGIDHGRTYGIFFDNSYWSSFDMGKEFPDRYSFGAVNGAMNYYFFYGPSPKKVLQRFTELVGRMPLPPRWSLGYQQCRWSYFPESRVRKLAADFRSKRIPCDVLYLDIDYMEGYRIFTWSKKNFPQPKKMIHELSASGFKIVTIVDPGIKVDSTYSAYQTGSAEDVFLKYPDGRVYTGKVWPGLCAFPDFSSARVRRWWGKNLAALTDAGVRGFWNDMNEPSVFDVPTKTVDLDVIHDDEGLRTSHAKNHNHYGLEMTQATYEGARSLNPSERPFVLTRASYAGGQRYAAAWTGDNMASWEHLEMAVPMMLGLSVSGQPFVGTDIGGFVGSPSGELYARWLQLGVFSPLMRTHTEWGSNDQEPWSYGSVFEEINRRTIELRYRLLPYIYTAMVQAAHTGIPPLRPLVFDYPDDPRYAREQTTFMFGNDLLVAPVLWPGDSTRTLSLPQGAWYDYWTGKRYAGGAQMTVAAPIDRIPMFAREGSIIPTAEVMQYSEERTVDPLTFTVFSSDSACTEYYEDDGHTYQYEKGAYAKRVLTLTRSGSQTNLVIGAVEGSYRTAPRTLLIRMLGIEAVPANVSVAGTLLPQAGLSRSQDMAETWTYDPASKNLTVKVRDVPQERVIAIATDR